MPVRYVVFVAATAVAAACSSTVAPRAVSPSTTTAVRVGAETVVRDCEALRNAVRPAVLVLACGDGAISAVVSVWTMWSTTSAAGTGHVEVDDCRPDCATGHPVDYAATFRLDRPVAYGSVRYFTRLTIRFRSRSPGPRHTVVCPMVSPVSPGGCVVEMSGG